MLPATLGGVGLPSAARLAPATRWAALPVVQTGSRAWQKSFRSTCPTTIAAPGALPRTGGWEVCPTWHDIINGPQASPGKEAGLGDWPHGLRTRDLYYRDRVLLPTLPPRQRALLRSQSGPHAGSWLAAIQLALCCDATLVSPLTRTG